jgi:hypothetical protein
LCATAFAALRVAEIERRVLGEVVEGFIKGWEEEKRRWGVVHQLRRVV